MAHKLYAISEGLTLAITNISGNVEGVLRGIGQGGSPFTLPLTEDALRRLQEALSSWLDKLKGA